MTAETEHEAGDTFAESIVAALLQIYDRLHEAEARIGRGTARKITEVGGPYGVVRRYFRGRSDRHHELSKKLKQARIPTPYDVYLSRAVHRSVLTAAAGVAAGVLLSYVLWSTGFLAGLRSPVRFSGGTASLINANATYIQATAITVTVALLSGVTAFTAQYYYPWIRADQRRRNIEMTLPHAIIFMHALSYGGMSLLSVMKELSRSEDIYEEVANEFDAISRDMEEFGTELPRALQNARNITPSDSIKMFYDDLLSTIDSGGDVTKFLRDEAERYLQTARDEQEDFINGLGVLGEIYTTVFIAAPLLFIVVLLVMSFIGANTLGALKTIIYLGMPLGVLMFGLLLHVTSKPYAWSSGHLVEDEDYIETPPAPSEELKHDVRYQRYRRTRTLNSIQGYLSNPLEPVYRRPSLSLVFSVPAALIYLVLALETGLSSTSGMETAPVWTTTTLFVAPFAIALLPTSYFHEAKRRKVKKIVTSFPDKLSAVSNANEMGMSLTESMRYVSERGAGPLNEELRRISNDIEWKHNTSQALVDSANRLRIPQVSRSMNLLSEASRSTGELTKILQVAAYDAMNDYRMRKQRTEEMSGYIAVILVSFLVYLGVVLLLDMFYLQPLYESIAAIGESEVQGSPTGVGELTEIPLETYRMLFYHSALILAFGNGLLAGKMGENDLFGGLKYAFVFVAITVVAFWGLT